MNWAFECRVYAMEGTVANALWGMVDSLGAFRTCKHAASGVSS